MAVHRSQRRGGEVGRAGAGGQKEVPDEGGVRGVGGWRKKEEEEEVVVQSKAKEGLKNKKTKNRCKVQKPMGRKKIKIQKQEKK